MGLYDIEGDFLCLKIYNINNAIAFASLITKNQHIIHQPESRVFTIDGQTHHKKNSIIFPCNRIKNLVSFILMNLTKHNRDNTVSLIKM